MENNQNGQGGNPGNMEQYQRQRPTIRPLQPVGVEPPQPTAPDGEGLVFRDKPQKSPATVGIICGALGLALGGAGIYGLMQILNPSPECPECDCSDCPVKNASSDLTTGFFALEPEGQNLIYSPLSIRYGLSLLGAGASGTTKTQIKTALGGEELPQYQNVADTLSLANAVFIRDSYQESVLESYTNTVTKDYDAEVVYDDFADTFKMDSWVSHKTFGLIDRIGIETTSDTEMVLANALAIQMDWQNKFSTDDTSGRSFYLDDGAEVKATTMTQLTDDKDISYYKDDDITLLSLPLESTDEASLEFVAVMPSGNLTEYMRGLNLSIIETALQNATPASTPEDGVEIFVPKFKYEYALNFADDLKKLGVTEAFDSEAADFSKMTSNPQGLYVSDAVHKANIDFSEEGIKAAAITAFAMVDGVAMDEEIPQPEVVEINHPFFFLIRDKENGAVWFTGTVYEPNLWEDDAEEYQAED